MTTGQVPAAVGEAGVLPLAEQDLLTAAQDQVDIDAGSIAHASPISMV